MNIVLLLLLTFVSIDAGLLPTVNQNEHKSRVLDLPLSEQNHFKDLQHNAEYDHEAFLGADEAKTFENLSPDESKRRLGLLFDRIDVDHNGTISEEELKDWIKSVQHRYINKDVERQWQQMKNDSSVDGISWDEYDKTMYHALYDNIEETKQMKEQYLRLQKKDRRRFLRADQDKNGRLNKREFTDFIHPEQSPRMKDLIILETIEDMDRNGDGLISETEYIRDMWEADGQSEPDWLKTERENFRLYRDRDHDGQLNPKEVELWLMPTDYDNIQAETVHLFREADLNQDHQLTKEEIVGKYEVFVGSQATDWGAELNVHDDL